VTGSLQDLLRLELVTVVADVEGDILDEMIRQYRSGKLTPDTLFAYIGEIAGIRRLATRVDQGVRSSRKKAQVKDGDPPPED